MKTAWQRRTGTALLTWGLLLLASPPPASAQTLGRCGAGWLERLDDCLVLHLKGSPWEMGYQHGALLKEHVRQNMHTLLDVKGDRVLASVGRIDIKPRHLIAMIITIQKKHVPPKYFTELAGLAAGADVSEHDARLTNFIPELFHCSGFAVMNTATADGTLYHGRVLDYMIDCGLQDHAVVVVCEPDGGIPFVNIGFAGFIGSVTGMNARGISIGEMGGGGAGHYNGVPMALLVREALTTAGDLDAAIAVFRDRRRTCQYYYVIADGRTNRAVGLEASWNVFTMVRPGQRHPLLTRPVPDCVLFSQGDRYGHLVDRVKAAHGRLTAPEALKLMSRPVAMKSNLHNVLFEPKTGRFWVAVASADGRPAAEQPYHAFRLGELLERRPAAGCPVQPLPARTVAATGN